MPDTSEFVGIDPLLESLEGHSRLLWAIGIGFYGIGDTLTTVVGFWAGRGVEAGPVVALLMAQAGILGLLVVKVAVLLGFYLAWRVLHSPGRVGIPLALSIVGVFVTGWNGVVLVVGTTTPAITALLGVGPGP